MFFFLSKAAVRRVIAEAVALLCCFQIAYHYVFGGKVKADVGPAQPYQEIAGVDWCSVEGGAEPEPKVVAPNSLKSRSPNLSPQASVHKAPPRSIRTRRRVRFTPIVEEVVGFAFSKSDYDRTVIKTDKPKQTEDVLTWISSALQNNTNKVTANEKFFFVNNVITLYDTDFSDYESSLSECVVQFVLREVAIKESALLKLKLCRDSLCNSCSSADPAAEKYRGQLLRLVHAHIRLVEALEPWDSDKSCRIQHECIPQWQCAAVAVH